MLVLALSVLAFSLNLKPTIDYMVTRGTYPGITVLAQALVEGSANQALLNNLDNAKDPLAAALALKILGFKVPAKYLEVQALTPCQKAEKAFVYKVLGLPGWKAMIDSLLRNDLFTIANSGYACACKTAYFLALAGYNPSWGIYYLQLNPQSVRTVEALIWCSAYQKLFGINKLFEALLSHISPTGAVTNSIGMPDDYLTAQFLLAFSLLKFKAHSTTTTTTTTTPSGVAITTITITMTQERTQYKTSTVTKTVYATKTVTKTMYVTSTKLVYGTLKACVPLTNLMMTTTQVVSTQFYTLNPSIGGYAVAVIPAEKGVGVSVTCNGSCGKFYIGENYTVAPGYVGATTTYTPYGGNWATAPCGSGYYWEANGPVTIYAVGTCPQTITAYLTSTITVACAK